jgi:hypothetical protein
MTNIVTPIRSNRFYKANICSLKPYTITLLGLWFAGAIILILRSILLCDGHLIYTQDDPYIHLRVAQIILRNGYGINIGEYSSPCSSIIYPYLLALTELAGFGVWGPLVLNMLAMAFAVYAVSYIIQDYVFTYNINDRRFAGSKLLPLALGLLVCFAMNSWGLVMTGMEHSLHVLAVVLVIWGFLKILDAGSKFPPWLIAAIVVLPFIRFEGLAMSLLSLAALLYLGHRRIAFGTASLILLGLLCWVVFTHSLGLPVLPSSVLLKSNIAANAIQHSSLAQLARAILSNFEESMSNGLGIWLLLTLLVVFILSYKAWQKLRHQIAIVLGGLTILTVLAHIFGGTGGLFSRYVVYVYTLVMISTLVLGRFWFDQANVKRTWTVFFVYLLVSLSYVMTSFLIPKAAQNTYQQQYQMHRFAVEYWKQPVAVNDLGWVSYNNPSFVLDLYGLGSEEVRRLKMTGVYDTKTLFMLVERKHVSLIMIYDEWFKSKIPTDWKKVAILNTSQVTSASDHVSFYITPKANRTKALDLLHQFGKTLPKGAVLNLVYQGKSGNGC